MWQNLALGACAGAPPKGHMGQWNVHEAAATVRGGGQFWHGLLLGSSQMP